MIYFVQSGTTGPIKIGYTSKDDVKERIANLQTSHHEQLHLLGIMAGDKEIETKLHLFYSPHRIRGEWFESTPQVLMFIMGLIQGYATNDLMSRINVGHNDTNISGMKLPDFLATQEKHLIHTALKQTNGNVTQAALLLGISFRSLRYRLEKYPELQV